MILNGNDWYCNICWCEDYPKCLNTCGKIGRPSKLEHPKFIPEQVVSCIIASLTNSRPVVEPGFRHEGGQTFMP